MQPKEPNPFGLQIIATREIPMWINVLKQDAESKEAILEDLQLIDDLLILMKSKSLLNRKKNLKVQLEARIGASLGHKTPNLNSVR